MRIRVVTTLAAAVVATFAGGAPSAVADSCPTYNPPNEMTLGGGTPQSAKLGTPFATNLQVGFANTNGCAITTSLSGIAVTFAAPGSGPSGTFASSGANAVLVGTDSSGNASAPQFTANMLPGGYLVTASSAYGAVTFSLVNTAVGVASTVQAVSPPSESAAVAAQYAKPLQVKVLDANGNPVPGASVDFAITAANSADAAFAGGMAQATAVANASGIATSPAFTANTDVGRFSATASIAGVSSTVVFGLRNVAAKAPTIEALGPSHMSATVGGRFTHSLKVKVVDGSGKPVQGASVAFSLGGTAASASGSAGGAGGTFVGGSAQATGTTNASGVATSPRLAANTVAGTFTATATTASTTKAAVVTLRNKAAKPHTITAGVAASETTAPGTAFPVRLAVTVEDAHGNAVAGAVVTFTAPLRGPSGHFHGKARRVEVKSDAEGVAVAPVLVANHTSGGYVVRATVHGVSGAAAFGLVNESA